MTRVFNLATGQERFYSCAPFPALVAAYAQERKDWNTWDYWKYWTLVDYTRRTYLLGDWTTIHD